MGPLLWKMMLVWFDLLKSFTKTYKYNTLTKWFLLWDTNKTQTSVMIRITYIIRRSWLHRSTAKLYQLKIVLELLAWTCLHVIITEEKTRQSSLNLSIDYNCYQIVNFSGMSWFLKIEANIYTKNNCSVFTSQWMWNRFIIVLDRVILSKFKVTHDSYCYFVVWWIAKAFIYCFLEWQ